MIGSIKRIPLAATAVAALAPATAFGQSTENATTNSADILVTARRVEERLHDVPISITVFSQEQLANRNIVNSADLATYAPSLSVNGRYGPDKSSFAIRGFSQDIKTLPTVAVYFADAVSPHLTSNITSGNGAGVGNLFGLQNVQVLKGPQGFDFGYAYLNAKVKSGRVPICDTTRFVCSAATFLASGSPLPFAPKNRITLTGTYTLPLDESVGSVSLSATFTHTDRQPPATDVSRGNAA